MPAILFVVNYFCYFSNTILTQNVGLIAIAHARYTPTLEYILCPFIKINYAKHTGPIFITHPIYRQLFQKGKWIIMFHRTVLIKDAELQRLLICKFALCILWKSYALCFTRFYHKMLSQIFCSLSLNTNKNANHLYNILLRHHLRYF